MSYVLGIDSSTTATKAVLVDGAGEVVAAGSRQYGFETPRPGWAEQHPDLWWEGALGAVADVLDAAGINGSQVSAVGLTGQMHGLVMLDASGDVLRSALLWNDQRTSGQCDDLRRVVGAKRLIEITGNDAMTGFTAPKIAWVLENEPEVFAKIAMILLPKDYLRFKLTGQLATDVADGSGTLLMDVSQRDWSSVMVESVGLSLGQLPELFEGPEITGALTTDAAGQTGLTVGTPVVAGAGDQAANAVGVGAVDSEIGALSMGTSGVVFVASEVPVVEPQGRIHSFCHAAPARWHAMGVILSAAGSLAWYRQTLAPDVPFGELVAEAGLVPPGSEGLRFLPYLTGERTPHSDPDAKGAFIGLTVRHERGHLTRAVMEGVAFGLADAHALIRSSGIEMPKVFNASGGGTRSRLWRQIVADVLRAEVATVKTVEGAAFGAALLAGVGAGWWGSVDKAVECVEPVDVVGPGPSAGEHQHAYESYVELYPALKGVFPRLN